MNATTPTERPSARATVHACLTPTDRRRLEAVAKARQLTLSIAVRQAVRMWLDREEATA